MALYYMKIKKGNIYLFPRLSPLETNLRKFISVNDHLGILYFKKLTF